MTNARPCLWTIHRVHEHSDSYSLTFARRACTREHNIFYVRVHYRTYDANHTSNNIYPIVTIPTQHTTLIYYITVHTTMRMRAAVFLWAWPEYTDGECGLFGERWRMETIAKWVAQGSVANMHVTFIGIA